MLPANIVINSWLMLPIKVINMAFHGFATFNINTLPKNSPTLLGVKLLTLMPANMALKERRKLIFSTFAIMYFHFNASKLQFTSIKINIMNKGKSKLPFNIKLLNDLKSIL